MNKLKKQLVKFIIAGCLAVTTDLLSYYILLNFLSHNISKTVSFILGTIVAYIINKFWTFEKNKKSYREIYRFALLYTITLFANVFTNKITLELTKNTFLSFIVATGVSTVFNFLGQKFWVFKK